MELLIAVIGITLFLILCIGSYKANMTGRNKRLLAKNGWEPNASFKNPRSGNTVVTYIKLLHDTGIPLGFTVATLAAKL